MRTGSDAEWDQVRDRVIGACRTALPMLERLLAESDLATRIRVVEALGQMGPAADRLRPAMAAVRDDLSLAAGVVDAQAQLALYADLVTQLQRCSAALYGERS